MNMWHFSQWCKNFSIIVKYHINKLKNYNKNLMTISVDAEKSFDKIQHQFMIKTLQKVGRGNIPQHNLGHIQQIYSWHHTQQKKLKAFPLRWGARQRLLPILNKIMLNDITLEILVIAIREEKEIEGIQVGKKELNIVTVCRWHDTINRK